MLWKPSPSETAFSAQSVGFAPDDVKRPSETGSDERIGTLEPVHGLASLYTSACFVELVRDLCTGEFMRASAARASAMGLDRFAAVVGCGHVL